MLKAFRIIKFTLYFSKVDKENVYLKDDAIYYKEEKIIDCNEIKLVGNLCNFSEELESVESLAFEAFIFLNIKCGIIIRDWQRFSKSKNGIIFIESKYNIFIEKYDLSMFNEIIFEHHSKIVEKDYQVLVNQLKIQGFKIKFFEG